MRRTWCAPLLMVACTQRVEPPRPPARPPVQVGSLDGRPVLAASTQAGVALLEDGTPVLGRSARGWEPLPPVTLPVGAQLALADGRRLWAIRYADDNGQTQAHWIAPAHRSEELERRQRELTVEAGRLPPAIAARVMPQLSLVALVSATEGDFGDPATRLDDRAASLGLFQWAAERDTSRAAGSSLSRFFVALKKRALSKEGSLYVRAWKQCKRSGFDVSAGNFRLHHRPATPAQVVAALREEFGQEALRTYQLVAAVDWIDEVRSTVIRPGHRGGALLGHGYAEAEAGRMVRFDVAGRAVRVRTIGPTTVGDLLRGPTALATAVSLGVNRPHYVESALWQVLVPPDAAARVYAALEAGRTEEASALIWPKAGNLDEHATLAAFRERALELYRPGDRERRARRLVTALLLEGR